MASSSSTSLSFSLILLLSLLSLSSAKTLTKAAGILSDSGYNYMSLALEITANHSLIFDPPSLTVFVPADSAFENSGQTSFSVYLLHYHLVPSNLHLQSLNSLRFGTRISTLLSRYSLTVTTRLGDRHVSLNNVTVVASPIYDDGSLVIYGIETFFDPRFRISGPSPNGMTVAQYVSRVIELMESKGSPSTAAHYVGEAGKVIKSQITSATASFVEMQILRFVAYQARLIFSRRVGHVMLNRIGCLSRYSSILRRHVAPCKLYGNDLVSLDDGAVLEELMSRNDSVLVVNGVAVIMPETCRNDWLVVPGISEVLELADSATPSPIHSAIQSLRQMVLWVLNTAKVMLLWLWNTAPVKFLCTLLCNFFYADMPLFSLLSALFILICFEALGFGVGYCA